MAVYRFRVTFEDYDEVYREIDVLSKHTFLDLHQAIHQATGYQPAVSSSFYISNDQWKKGQEIALMPTEKKQDQGVVEMENARLSKFVNDPHQKFYYVYNFERPYDFHVELIKIFKEDEGAKYPETTKSVGVAPKPFGSSAITMSDEEADSTSPETEDYDFLNETQYGIDEQEDLGLLDGEEGDSEGSDGSDEGDDGQAASGYEDGY